MVVAGLLAIQAGLLAWSGWRHSPTLNEPGHLAAGIGHWQYGRFELYRVNPPLVRMIAALPVLAAGVEPAWDGVHYAPGERPTPMLGARLARRNGRRIFWLMTLARWACIPLMIAGGLVCYLWARDLFGPTAGIVALVLWTFSPNLLGHGALITADAPAAALGVTAAYAFWKWLGDPSWSGTLLAGMALGAAALTKFTLLVFYPLWPLLWLVYRRPFVPPRHHPTSAGRPLAEAGRLAAMMAVSLWIINAGYAFEAVGKPLGKYAFVSSLFKGEMRGAPRSRFDGSWLGLLPVPLPENYLLGIDVQRRDFERYGSPSYLRGRFQSHGWWYYYVYGLMVKMPLAMWGLIGMAILSMTPPSRTAGDPAPHMLARPRDQLCVLLPMLVILALASSQTGFGEHVRYVFPVLPFLFVWVSQAVGLARAARFPGLVLASLVAWFVASSLYVYPHSLSYFNELAGGPRGGSAHLLHSNIDWGQDLLYLKRWLDSHPDARPMHVEYFGPFSPDVAGIDFPHVPRSPSPPGTVGGPALPEDLVPGWYAVSVNYVRGYPFHPYEDTDEDPPLPRDALAYFLRFEPVAMAGYSIYIYRLDEDDLAR